MSKDRLKGSDEDNISAKLISELEKSKAAIKYWENSAQRMAAKAEKAKAEMKRLREIILVNNLWHEPPCCLCGYNGPGYYNSDKHACVAEVATIHKKRMEISND